MLESHADLLGAVMPEFVEDARLCVQAVRAASGSPASKWTSPRLAAVWASP